MFSIEIKVEGVEKFNSGISRQLNFQKNQMVKIAAKQIRQHFFSIQEKLFSTEGGSGSHGKWAELSPQYKKYKQLKYPGRGIMERKGTLKDSLTKKTGLSVFELKRLGNSFEIIIGTKVLSKQGFDYPVYHQERANKKRRTIDPNELDRKKYEAIIYQNIIDVSKKFGAWDGVN